jgi:putative hydrolase, CocE/NonD family
MTLSAAYRAIRALSFVLGFGLALGVLLPGAVRAQGSVADYDGISGQSLHIPSFDGTRIAITVYRPTRNGWEAGERLPVIVTQNRSEANPRMLAEMRRYTGSGYIWIAQDRRGTGASFGVQTGFVNQADAKDAKAVIDWAASQPFSSGKTVALGCSNQGAWQYLVATMRPESLVAIAPACASPMFYDDAVAINGIPMIALADKPYAGECREGNTGARPGNMAPPPPAPVDADTDGALLRAAQAEQRCGAPMLGQYWRNMPRDGMNDFAGYQPALADTAMTQWEVLRDSGIAILQIGGWFDAAVPGQIEGQRAFGGRVIMGPWVHGNRAPRNATLPNEAMDLTAETLAFFDRYAKEVPNGADQPAFRYYTINAAAGDEWRSAERWPSLPRRTLYLGAGSTLTATTSSQAGRDTLAPGGARWFDGRYSPLARWHAGDFTTTNSGSLTHESAAMTQAMELTGTVTANLWISADRPDTNVFAMLQDVAPDGSATYVTDGRLRASWRATAPLPWPGAERTWHRGNADDIKPLVPGEPTLLRFDFFPISYVLREGHRLRLAITSAIGQDHDAPLAGDQPVTLTLHRGADHPSALTLPLKPY